jgi:hypothetical protein
MSSSSELAPDPVSAESFPLQGYLLHGLAVELHCAVPSLDALIRTWLHPFAESVFPPGFIPARGHVLPYDSQTVLRHLSPSAVAIASHDRLGELYQEGERFWVIDDRWGLTELNLLKGLWRSWVLPRPQLDPTQCAERAIFWPLAQILRSRGLHLTPAVSVARDGWGVLLLGGVGLEPELRALLNAGYKLLGQRWTALREEEERVAMLGMPLPSQRAPSWRGDSTGLRHRALAREQLRMEEGSAELAEARALSQGFRRAPAQASVPAPASSALAAPPNPRPLIPAPPGWVDLSAEFLGTQLHHAFCDSVLVIEPGRRAKAHARQISLNDAPQHLRQAWPIQELHPQRRYSGLQPRLARSCPTWQVQLSHEPAELLMVLDSLRHHGGSPAHMMPHRISLDVPPVQTTPLGRIGAAARRAG